MKFTSVIFILISISTFSIAQEPTKKKFQAGFSLSPNYSFLQAKGSKPKELNLLPGIGMGLGLNAEYHFQEKISLSTRIGLSFNNVYLDYQNSQGELLTSTRVYNQTLDFSLLGHYYLGAKNNKPFLLFGPSVITPLNKSNNEPIVVFNRTTVAIDLGIGFDMPLKSFHFAPEIRYSYGLNNINSSPQLNQLYYHRLTLALNFKE